jgi:hypothetical protein
MKTTKMKMGAIVRDVPQGSMEWYIRAGWKKLEVEDVKTDTKKNVKR